MQKRPLRKLLRRPSLKNRLTVFTACLIVFSLLLSLPAGSASYGPSAGAAQPSPEADTGQENYDIRVSSSKQAQIKLEQSRQKMSPATTMYTAPAAAVSAVK